MMKHYKILLVCFTTLITACWQPQPVTRVQKVLGLVEAQVSLDGVASARLMPSKLATQNALPDNAITFERKFVSSFEDETSKTRYVSATFQVNNATDQDFNNLGFYAYTQENKSIGGTAVKAMANFGGELITDPTAAQGMKPTHEMKRQGLAIGVNPQAAHFQGFGSTEIQNLEQAAKSNGTIGQNDHILEYGYIAENTNGTRPIAKRSNGLLTIAIKYPSTNKTLNPYKFVMTFVLADDSQTRVTRSPEESTNQAIQRAYTQNATELMMIGGDADTSPLTNLRSPNLLIGTAPTYLLENTFSINQISPSVIQNDQENIVTIAGSDFNSQTKFFIESKQLETLSINATTATVRVPTRLEPANYGIIGKQSNGNRATRYPALLVRAGDPPRPIDPQDNSLVFIEGYVFDNQTNQAIENATVGIPGLETSTDQNGYYLMRGVPVGKNHLTIKANEYTDNYRTLEILNTTAKTIQVKPLLLQPHSHTATIIGRNGGTHYATPNNAQGAHFIVPPDALEQDVVISLTELPEEAAPEFADNQVYLGAAHFEPSGLVFKKPALYNTPLPSNNTLAIGTSVKVGTYDHSTGQWIEEPQQGKIISIQGKKFLQIQMLHFTHASGWYPTRDDNDTGSILYNACVRYDDGTAAAIIPTNRGYTDDFGMIEFWSNSLTPSWYTLNPKSAFGSPVPVPLIPPTCIILPKPKTGTLNPLEPQQDNPCNPDPRPLPVDKGATLKPQNTNLEKQLLIAKNTTALSTQLLDFSSSNIDPSSLKVLVNNEDVTKRLDIKQNASSVRIDYKLLTNLPAKANTEFVIRAKTRGTVSEPPVDLEVKTNVDIVGKFSTAPINLIELSPTHNDDTLPIDPFALEDTPTVVYAGGQVNVLYKTGDDLSNIDVNVPVVALAENGGIVPVNFPSIRFDDQNWKNGSFSLTAPMQNGVAIVPIKLKISNPADFSIDIGNVVIRLDSSTALSTIVARPQVLVLAAIPVAVAAFEIVSAAVVGTVATVAVVKTAMCLADASYCESNMNGIADELLESRRAIPIILPSAAIPAGGVCRATTTAAPAARKPRNRALAPIASPVQCVPKPDQSSGSSSKPAQERFNENEAKPSTLDYDAQQGIWDKFLQEADLFCRFGKGTFRDFSQIEKDILVEAGKLWKGGNGASREAVLEFLKRKKLIGEFGKYTGHHQNSKACFPGLARDVRNLTIVESKDSVHRDICHGGKYGNCTAGELFKEVADIIDDFLDDPDFEDLTVINQCR